MNKPRPRHVFYLYVIVESVFFLIAAFAANYLITGNRNLYVIVAAIVTLCYGAWRVFQLRDDRYRIKVFETLSDALARSAEAYGVTSIYNMQIGDEQNQRNSDTQAAIRNAHSMFLCANSGASYLSAAAARHRPHIIDKLKSGHTFQVLLLDPLSAEKRLRNDLNVQGELTDSKLPLGDVIRMCNEYPRLDVRFIEHGMTCSLFFADDDLFYDPYHLAVRDGRIENRLFCLRFERRNVVAGLSYFDLFQRHRDALWERAERIEEWLPAKRSRIEQELNIRNLPVLRREQRVQTNPDRS
jgi:hypothetical protein